MPQQMRPMAGAPMMPMGMAAGQPQQSMSGQPMMAAPQAQPIPVNNAVQLDPFGAL
jgi:hypothetical protein